MNLTVRHYLIKRFPYLEKAIGDKLEASKNFRDLCEDYVDAAETLSRWEDDADPTPELQARITEYRGLVKTLEKELLLELYQDSPR